MQPRRALASAAAALVLLAAVLVVPAAASPARGRRLAKAPKPEASPPQAFPAAPADCCAALAAVGLRSELPVVVLDSGGQPIPHHVDTPVALCTCANGSPFQDYAGPALAAGRGSSSSTFAKKSYAVALKAPGGGKAAFPFLGMPVDEDWILYGDETADKTLGLRNFATYNLARASGHYASRTVWAELYLVDDGAPLGPQHYNGLYIGEEKVKRVRRAASHTARPRAGLRPLALPSPAAAPPVLPPAAAPQAKARVDIAKLAPPDLSGGYIWLYDNDNIESSDTTFGPAPGWDHPFLLKEPKAAPDGGAALLRYIDDFQAALEAPDWLARGPNASYTAFIDGPSFAAFFLLVELSKSPDGNRGSTFMHKDRGGPLVFGPVWDYNEVSGGESAAPWCQFLFCESNDESCSCLPWDCRLHDGALSAADPWLPPGACRRTARAAATRSTGGSGRGPRGRGSPAGPPSPPRAGATTSATTPAAAWWSPRTAPRAGSAACAWTRASARPRWRGGSSCGRAPGRTPPSRR